MEKALVSVLTPCYNTGKYIHRLLDSVLSQTYPSIEMVIIDDGSTDNSSTIIHSYIPKFKAKGYELKYYYQENSGQSVAIKKGLHLVHGEYLVWPDSDDFYASDEAIEKMVTRLSQASPEFAMVRTMLRALDENNLSELYIKGNDAHEIENKTLFEDCLFGNFYFNPGAYMVRMSALTETTNLEIYTSKDAGQNWQLYLPVLYSYRCITIKEVLYNIVERESSHSRGSYKGYEQILQRINAYEETLLATLDNIKKMSENLRDIYKNEILYKYLREKLVLALRHQEFSCFLEYYKQLQYNFKKRITLYDLLYYWSIKTKTYSILKQISHTKDKVLKWI